MVSFLIRKKRRRARDTKKEMYRCTYTDPRYTYTDTDTHTHIQIHRYKYPDTDTDTTKYIFINKPKRANNIKRISENWPRAKEKKNIIPFQLVGWILLERHGAYIYGYMWFECVCMYVYVCVWSELTVVLVIKSYSVVNEDILWLYLLAPDVTHSRIYRFLNTFSKLICDWIKTYFETFAIIVQWTICTVTKAQQEMEKRKALLAVGVAISLTIGRPVVLVARLAVAAKNKITKKKTDETDKVAFASHSDS